MALTPSNRKNRESQTEPVLFTANRRRCVPRLLVFIFNPTQRPSDAGLFNLENITVIFSRTWPTGMLNKYIFSYRKQSLGSQRAIFPLPYRAPRALHYIYSIRTEECFQSNEMAAIKHTKTLQSLINMSWTGSFSSVIIIPAPMNTWVSDGRRQTILFAFNYILITRGWYKLIFFLFSDGQGRLMTGPNQYWRSENQYNPHSANWLLQRSCWLALIAGTVVTRRTLPL